MLPDLFPLFPSTLPASLWSPLAILVAVCLDRCLGEPRRWHPLVGFGHLAQAIERLGQGASGSLLRTRLAGCLAWCMAVLPWVALASWLTPPTLAGWIADIVLLAFALGGRSLTEHARRVADDLAAGQLNDARQHVSWMVSRETDALDASGVATACIESTLENGNDAVFGALFWFILLGGPGAILFRLANTLDAMWGYKTPRFLHFGWFAARLDDGLNYLPARLTALSYALVGSPSRALSCWQRQAPQWDSPNAGPVMAAGAGSLGLTLGGAATYLGRIEMRPTLGAGRLARADDIPRALALLHRSLLLWLALFIAWGMIHA